jgi:ABC-type polysaccharide/polyol phosphate export permease
MLKLTSKNHFIQDLLDVLPLLGTIIYWARTDLIVRYRATYFGPLWMSIGIGMGSIGLGIFWSALWNIPASTMVPSVTIGFLSWNMISGIISEAPNLIRQKSQLLSTNNIPLSFLVLNMITTHVLNFLHGTIFIALVLIIFPNNLNTYSLLIIPNFVLVLIFLVSTSHLFMLYGAKYADFAALTSTLMPLVFFISPVVFRLDQAAGIRQIMILNPLTHLITLIRNPLEGIPTPAESYFASTILLTCLFAISFLKGRKQNLKNELQWIL